MQSRLHEDLLAVNHELATLKERLEDRAARDPLTTIWNRGAIVELLSRELARSRRDRRPLAVVLADIDHFKVVNDTYGHLAGDYVLKQLAVEIKRRIRREDILARYGGEEFAIVLPELDNPNAVHFAEKIRRIAAEAKFRFDETDIPVTVSVGVTTMEPSVHEAAAFIKRADEALYRAKSNGRNCVVG
jgi:diguanylate cyclase (GGDEF)-like protein